jgi:hypothetical protein
METTICVAGKNEIAVNALSYLLKHYPQHSICFVPNSTDSGFNTWQPSMIKTANDLGVRRVRLPEIYDVDNLFFFPSNLISWSRQISLSLHDYTIFIFHCCLNTGGCLRLLIRLSTGKQSLV